MFDAHSHFEQPDTLYCTSEFLPQNYDGRDVKSFKTSNSEIGLDKRFESLLSIDKQICLLKALLEIALKYNKPVTLHCVRKTEKMLEVIKPFAAQGLKFLWHGFNGSIETAKELSKIGVIISISPSFTKDVKELFSACPLTVLETDYEGSDLKEYESILYKHYSTCAGKTGMTIKQLEEHCREIGSTFKN